MFVLGLTGPSGAGKTFAAGVFRSEGFAVVDADRIARAVVEPGEPCLQRLAEAFGPGILRPDGSLDRRRLADLAFPSPERLERLNAITHPFILARIRGELTTLRKHGTAFALLDAPALFQSGAETLCDRVAVVLAPEAARLNRLYRRDGLSPEEARRRIGAVCDNFFTDRADDILRNDGDEASFEKALRAYARGLLARGGNAAEDTAECES